MHGMHGTGLQSAASPSASDRAAAARRAAARRIVVSPSPVPARRTPHLPTASAQIAPRSSPQTHGTLSVSDAHAQLALMAEQRQKWLQEKAALESYISEFRLQVQRGTATAKLLADVGQHLMELWHIIRPTIPVDSNQKSFPEQHVSVLKSLAEQYAADGHFADDSLCNFSSALIHVVRFSTRLTPQPSPASLRNTSNDRSHSHVKSPCSAKSMVSPITLPLLSSLPAHSASALSIIRKRRSSLQSKPKPIKLSAAVNQCGLLSTSFGPLATLTRRKTRQAVVADVPGHSFLDVSMGAQPLISSRFVSPVVWIAFNTTHPQSPLNSMSSSPLRRRPSPSSMSLFASPSNPTLAPLSPTEEALSALSIASQRVQAMFAQSLKTENAHALNQSSQRSLKLCDISLPYSQELLHCISSSSLLVESNGPSSASASAAFSPERRKRLNSWWLSQ